MLKNLGTTVLELETGITYDFVGSVWVVKCSVILSAVSTKSVFRHIYVKQGYASCELYLH